MTNEQKIVVTLITGIGLWLYFRDRAAERAARLEREAAGREARAV